MTDSPTARRNQETPGEDPLLSVVTGQYYTLAGQDGVRAQKWSDAPDALENSVVHQALLGGTIEFATHLLLRTRHNH